MTQSDRQRWSLVFFFAPLRELPNLESEILLLTPNAILAVRPFAITQKNQLPLVRRQRIFFAFALAFLEGNPLAEYSSYLFQTYTAENSFLLIMAVWSYVDRSRSESPPWIAYS
jgi:hypothetical protein